MLWDCEKVSNLIENLRIDIITKNLDFRLKQSSLLVTNKWSQKVPNTQCNVIDNKTLNI